MVHAYTDFISYSYYKLLAYHSQLPQPRSFLLQKGQRCVKWVTAMPPENRYDKSHLHSPKAFITSTVPGKTIFFKIPNWNKNIGINGHAINLNYTW